MDFGFEIVAAKSKREEEDDQPSSAPMRPMSSIRRNPSTDQKKVRRQMTKKASGNFYLTSVDTGTKFDAVFADWSGNPGLIPEDGFFPVKTMVTGEWFYARPTGRTRRMWGGKDAPTVELWNVENTVQTNADGRPSAVGVRGSRVPGIWVTNPDAFRSLGSLDLDGSVMPRYAASENEFVSEDGVTVGWENPDYDPTAGNAIHDEGYDDMVEFSDDWAHTGSIDLRSAVTRRAAEVSDFVKSASLNKQAWTADGSDITPMARRLMDMTERATDQDAWNSGMSGYRDSVEAFLAEQISPFVGQITEADRDVLEDYNYHVTNRAIDRALGRTASRRTASYTAYYVSYNGELLDGPFFSTADAWEVVNQYRQDAGGYDDPNFVWELTVVPVQREASRRSAGLSATAYDSDGLDEEDSDEQDGYEQGGYDATQDRSYAPIYEGRWDGRFTHSTAGDVSYDWMRGYVKGWIEANGDPSAIDDFSQSLKMSSRHTAAHSFSESLWNDSQFLDGYRYGEQDFLDGKSNIQKANGDFYWKNRGVDYIWSIGYIAGWEAAGGSESEMNRIFGTRSASRKQAGPMFPGAGAQVYYNDAGEPTGWDDAPYEHDPHDEYDNEMYDSGDILSDAEFEDGLDAGEEDGRANNLSLTWSNRDGFEHPFYGEVSTDWAHGYMEGWDNVASPSKTAPLRKHLASRKTAGDARKWVRSNYLGRPSITCEGYQVYKTNDGPYWRVVLPNGRLLSSSSRFGRVALFFSQAEAKQAVESSLDEPSHKTAMPAPADMGVKVGDIFYTSWGYDQTNVNFYQVVRLTGAGVEIRPIRSRVVSGDAYNESVVAEPDMFDTRDSLIGGDSKMCRLKSGYQGRPSISLSRDHDAWLWDGTPRHQSGPYGGH